MRLFALLGLLYASTSAYAQDKKQTLPAPITPYVSDLANLIDPETEAQLNKALMEQQGALDIQIVVVTIETRHDYGDWDSLDHFTNALFNTWGIGNPQRNDGILILISRSDRAMRIELGAAYGKVISTRVERVINQYFIPYFKGDEYPAGIKIGTLEIIKRLQPNYNVAMVQPKEKDNTAEPRQEAQSKRPNIVFIKSNKIIHKEFWDSIATHAAYQWAKDHLFLVGFIAILVLLLLEIQMRRALIGLRYCRRCQCNHIETCKKGDTPE